MSIKDIVKNHIENIEKFNLEIVYAACQRADKLELTKLLHQLDINPLEHVDVVPSMCYYNNHEDCPEAVALPDRITAIQPWAFCGSGVTTVLTNKVKNIMHGAFQDTGLDDVRFSDSLEQIQDDAFRNCIYLTDINLPSSLRSLGLRSFMNCSELTKVNIASNYIKEIPADCFSGCYNLKEINIPESIVIIGNDAFHNCGFEKLTFDHHVTLISRSFSNCSELSEVHIGADVEVHGDAFSDCPKLEKIYVDRDSKGFENMVFWQEGVTVVLNDGLELRV